MNETLITIVGNLVDDPKLRTTDGGVEVTSFRVASTSRRLDRDANRWVDYGQLFLGVTCWRALGVNVVASLRKGDPVVATGRLFTRQYEKDGQLRSSYEMDALAVGPDLARGTASFQRARPAVPSTHAATDERGLPEGPADLPDLAGPAGAAPAGPALAGPAPADPAAARPALAGSALAGSALAGSALAGSALAGSALAGSALAGSALAGSALAGSALAGSALAGSAPADPAPAGSALADPAAAGPALADPAAADLAPAPASVAA